MGGGLMRIILFDPLLRRAPVRRFCFIFLAVISSVSIIYSRHSLNIRPPGGEAGIFASSPAFAQSSYSLVPQTPWSTVPNGTLLTKEGNPWYAPTGMTLEHNTTLTIEKGVILKFGPGNRFRSQFLVYGSLIVNGTANEPVIFTSWHDDSDGSDIDGTVPDADRAPSRGDWHRVQMGTSGAHCKSELHHLTIRYADIGIELLQYNPADCAYITDHLAFEHNNQGISTTLPLDLRYSRFLDNGAAIYPWATSQPVDARWSDWGDTSGPTHPGNPRGTGEYISGSGLVLYNPWQGKGDLPLTQHEPVLVIPGILGSDIRMPHESAIPFLEKGDLVLDPVLHTYDELVLSLIDHYGASGVFAFPYQWRQDNTVTAQELKERIAYIKEVTGHRKVDIVAHSMGGLIARHYIESDEYAEDVDQLIMLGTPNRGAPKTYRFWEGMEGFESKSESILKTRIQIEAAANSYLNIISYVHDYIPSLGQLLPTYSYLINTSDGSLRQYPDNYPANTFIENLNDIGKLARFYQRVQPSTITSSDHDTIVQYRVGVPEQDKWEHGKVVETILGAGDGTVPIESALLPPVNIPIGITLPSLATIEAAPKHGDLPLSRAVIKQTIGLLTGREYEPSVIRRGVASVIFLFIKSPANAMVTDALGRSAGFDPVQGITVAEIPGSYTTAPNASPEFIAIPDPSEEEYEITLIGTGEGGEVELEAVLIKEQEEGSSAEDLPSARSFLNISSGEIKKFKLIADALQSENSLAIVPGDDDAPSIVFESPFPDAIYEHHLAIELAVRITDETPPISATSTLEGVLRPAPFYTQDFSGSMRQVVDLSTLSLGTHAWSIEASDALHNTTTTSTVFSIIATPSSFLKMIDYGVAHGWFLRPRAEQPLKKLMQDIVKIINKSPNPKNQSERLKIRSLAESALTILGVVHKNRMITNVGYDILKADLLYIRDY